MPQPKLSKKLKKMVIPKHERHCTYWAGCDPYIPEEGYCDCGLSEIESEPEVYVVLEEASKSLKSTNKH